MYLNPLSSDLDHILDHTRELWEEIRGQRLFITGGTGFFGCWMLESLTWANDRLNLGIEAVVLTRSPESFQKKAPHLASHPAIRLQAGDICTFDFPEGEFGLVIHAAVQSDAQNPLDLLNSIVTGTQRALDFAVSSKASKFLFTSSGAVYGRQPPELSHIPEDYPGAPDPTNPVSAYGEGKRLGELLCSLYLRDYGIQVKIARCFAFVGPYLPLDLNYAIGNFIRDGLRGGPIVVNGDGTPYRSYLYAADLTIWLWTILLRGQAGRVYNVGSDEAISIEELARKVAAGFEPVPTIIIQREKIPGRPAERYVPEVRRARREMDLCTWIDLGEAIRRTIKWNFGG